MSSVVLETYMDRWASSRIAGYCVLRARGALCVWESRGEGFV